MASEAARIQQEIALLTGDWRVLSLLDNSNHSDLQALSIVTSLDRLLSNRQGTRPSVPGTALTSTRTTNLR